MIEGVSDFSSTLPYSFERRKNVTLFFCPTHKTMMVYEPQPGYMLCEEGNHLVADGDALRGIGWLYPSRQQPTAEECHQCDK